MRAIVTFALLASACLPVLACSADGELSEESSDEGAILGGTSSGPEDDAVVALYRRGRLHCGATVIGRNILLTAQHCVAGMETTQRTRSMRGQIRPNELTVRIGSRPNGRTAAVVSRIVVPDELRLESGLEMSSNDVAILYVTPNDSSFARIRPRLLSTQPVRRGDAVTVVGYGGDGRSNYDYTPRGTAPARRGYGLAYGEDYDMYAGSYGGTTYEDTFGTGSSGWGNYSIERQRRSGVYVLTGANERGTVRANLRSRDPYEQGYNPAYDRGVDRSYDWTNRAREFTTEAVACSGDAGGPAFDNAGRVVGVISAVVGECTTGSITTYTDVTSHAAFIRRAIEGTRNFGCMSDDDCDETGAVCDSRTNHCIRGCRGGGARCGAQGSCSLTDDLLGMVGICRTTSQRGERSDPIYDMGAYLAPRNVRCPGDPRCPPVMNARECTTDAECPSTQPGKPRACDIPTGRCLDACRVGAQGMCPQGQVCGAFQEDPALGACQVQQVQQPTATTPPASPPALVPDTPAPVAPAAEVGTGTTTKKKNKAKADSEGCTVSSSASTQSTSSGGLALALTAFGLAAWRRRRTASAMTK